MGFRSAKGFNTCWVVMKLFEHEAIRLSVETSSEGQASVNVIKLTCVIVILAFHLIQPTKIALEMPLKYPFSYTGYHIQ